MRGLRALSDFENELAIAHLNRRLAPEIDTVFFMTGLEHAYLSSGLVREIAALGGDVSAMVPDAAARALRERVQALTAPAPRRGSVGYNAESSLPVHPGVRAIDLMFLIERLDALIEQGRRMPMSNAVMVDKVAATDLIEQLRVAVPEEVRQAKRINEESSRLVERAQDEAERIIARAQEQAAFLIEERELTRAAEQRSEEIIEEARAEAREIQQGADAYAANVLVKLEGEVVKALQSIRRGLSALDERYPPDGARRPSPRPSSGPMLSYNVADLLRSAPGTSEDVKVDVPGLPVAEGLDAGAPAPGPGSASRTPGAASSCGATSRPPSPSAARAACAQPWRLSAWSSRRRPCPRSTSRPACPSTRATSRTSCASPTTMSSTSSRPSGTPSRWPSPSRHSAVRTARASARPVAPTSPRSPAMVTPTKTSTHGWRPWPACATACRSPGQPAERIHRPTKEQR